MRKAKVFWARCRSSSLKRMWMHVQNIHRECGRPRLDILADMLWCISRYGVGYLEYHVFGFGFIRGKKLRQTYMNMERNLELVERVNRPEFRRYFEDKLLFLQTFREYAGRDFLDLRTASPEELRIFAEKQGTLFVKPLSNYGGHGVERILAGEVTDWPGLYERLISSGQVVVEGLICQHPSMDVLYPHSINSLRVVTLLTHGEAHVMYSLLRVGRGGSVVDNISSGGVYAPVFEDGRIGRPAFCDATGEYYKTHPDTGVEFTGFLLPDYDKAIDMVRQAAQKIPQVQYVGWDVAFSVNGPVLLEGNTLPGYDMCQNYYHLREPKMGIWPVFQRYLEDR